ncbi:unnamed protein product [Pedinophyceae sp. YPF-701]|nr:unnamed protein product [Pedinophyceae sp. YPF-701]
MVDGKPEKDTLAGASLKSVRRLLDKRRGGGAERADGGGEARPTGAAREAPGNAGPAFLPPMKRLRTGDVEDTCGATAAERRGRERPRPPAGGGDDGLITPDDSSSDASSDSGANTSDSNYDSGAATDASPDPEEVDEGPLEWEDVGGRAKPDDFIEISSDEDEEGATASRAAGTADGTSAAADKSEGEAKKKKRRPATAEERARALALHRAYGLAQLWHVRMVDAAAQDAELGMLCRAVAPARLVAGVQKAAAGPPTTQSVRALTQWFSNSFWTRVARVSRPLRHEGGAVEAAKARLRTRVQTRAGSAAEAAGVFCALLRGLGVRCRVVRALDLPPTQLGQQQDWIVERVIAERAAKAADAAPSVHRPTPPPGKAGRPRNTPAALASAPSAPPPQPLAAPRNEEERETQLAMLRSEILADVRGRRGGAGRPVSASRARGGRRKLLQARSMPVEAPRSGPENVGAERHWWTEVLAAGAHEKPGWVHVDPLRAEVGAAASVAGARPRDSPLTWVVAAENGALRDVTARYNPATASDATKQRDTAYFRGAFAALSRRADQAGTKGAAGPSNGRQRPGHDAEDAEELKAAAARERVRPPTTIEGFKNHPVYTLQRHILSYQGLRPGAKFQGLHKGEKFYLKSDVSDLRTIIQWRRRGREVLPERVNEPARRVTKGKTKEKNQPSRADDPPDEDFVDGGVGTKQVWVYGEWQTRAWVPAPVVDGRVPRNDRGNVECPPLVPLLPAGTTHLPGTTYPLVSRACKLLGVDYAPALVGFDRRGGRTVPVVDGVVVCDEFVEGVLEARDRQEEARMEEEAERRATAAASGWEKLARGLIARRYVAEEYGGARAADERGAQGESGQGGGPVLEPGGSGGGGAEAQAAAQPATDEGLDFEEI